jgi:hypothetical protein
MTGKAGCRRMKLADSIEERLAKRKAVVSVELLRYKLPTIWRSLNVPDTTSESRRDGVNVQPGTSVLGTHRTRLKRVPALPGRLKNVFDKFSRPLRDWTDLLILPRTDVLYIQAVPSGLHHAHG